MTRDIIALTLLMLVAVPAQPQQAVSPTAARNLEALVGKDDWARLPVRLQELNSDIRGQGLGLLFVEPRKRYDSLHAPCA